jgi:demethylmenaquinone methyltransferase/2-methoxy-6-polyprenyl-1,4-benzoquinol methylase
VLLELSKPRPGVFARVYRAYFYGVLPRAAAMLGGDPAAYAYLPDSLTPFPEPGGLAELLGDAGFREVRYTLLTFGIAAIHEGAR